MAVLQFETGIMFSNGSNGDWYDKETRFAQHLHVDGILRFAVRCTGARCLNVE